MGDYWLLGEDPAWGGKLVVEEGIFSHDRGGCRTQNRPEVERIRGSILEISTTNLQVLWSRVHRISHIPADKRQKIKSPTFNLRECCVGCALGLITCEPTSNTHTFDNHTQRLVLPSFPLFGGERGITLASRFPFVCVRLLLQVYLVVLKLSLLLSIDGQLVVSLCGATCLFRRLTPVIEVYDIPVDIPVCEVRKHQSHGLSAQYQWSSVKRLPKKPCETLSAEIHAPYKLFEPTTTDKTRFSGTARTNYKSGL